MKACPTCKIIKKAERCEHVPYYPQFFKTNVGYERQMAIMRSFQGAFEREHLNLMQEPKISRAFDPLWIDSMFDNKRKYNVDMDIPYVFISIDPSAGVGRSFYIIVSMFYPSIADTDKKSCVVCRPFLFIIHITQFLSILL